MTIRFATPRLMRNGPSPRTPLRCPVSPGSVELYAARAAVELAKMFGPGGPVTDGASLNAPRSSGTTPVCVAQPVMFQLVGQARPLPTLTGRPEDALNVGASCHPPIRASSPRP